MQVSTKENNQQHLKACVLQSVSIFKAHKRTILAAAIFTALTASITMLSREPIFVASAEVMLSAASGDATSMLTGPSVSDDVAPSTNELVNMFFSAYLLPAFLRSRTVSEHVLSRMYRYSIDGKEIYSDLYGYLNIRNKDAAIMKVKSSISGFYLDPATGITRIQAATSCPELSYQIVKEYAASVEECINRFRLNTIKENLSYIDKKLQNSSVSLERYEVALKTLREKNRDYSTINDPAFYLEQLRLEREIKIQEEMVITLKSYYELTMSKLISKGSQLTVITNPSIPSSFEYPNIKQSLMLSLIMAGITAFLFTIFFVLKENFPDRQRKQLVDLIKELESDLNWISSKAARLRHSTRIRQVCSNIFSNH